ncbi:MAG: adenosylcobinamide-phosphate synthase CbiB [Cyanobium sp.]
MNPPPSASLQGWLLVVLACCLDQLIGDPRGWLHPVVVMGAVISRLRRWAEAWAGDRPLPLRLAGGLITLLLVGGSSSAGWAVEGLALAWPLVGLPLLLLGLTSALAGRSLEQAVSAVLAALPNQLQARQRLAWIVGREVDQLDQGEILRAAAETASENAVDGLFAPLFWMLVGAALWGATPLTAPSLAWWPQGAELPRPGPLALAWGFKAASTLDSMLGYRRGRLAWLGTAGARLDDLLTWLPCRLVALSLPLAAARPGRTLAWCRGALEQGASDPSPNAGVSQAAYALAAGVRLGGSNRYADGVRRKPILAADNPAADSVAVRRILGLSTRLEVLWLLISGLVFLLLAAG